MERKIGSRFSHENRSAIYIFKSISDFEIAIAIMIAIEKPTRIDRDPILIRKSIRDFYMKTGSRLKNRNRMTGNQCFLHNDMHMSR